MEARQHVTVIGGGIAGLRTAKDLADLGVEVVLIEKSPFLGGQLAQLERLAPTGEPAADLITELAGQVLDDPRITVHTCSLVETFDGYVGNFTLGVKKRPLETDRKNLSSLNPSDRTFGEFIPFTGVFPKSGPSRAEEFTFETGVVVLATGFKSYTPRQGEYGYAEFPEVITLPELIRIMAENKTTDNCLEVNGRRIRSMAMIHCVGSRQIPGIHPEDASGNLNEYCSRTCCSATLNAANIIRDTYPGTRIFECYRDIRTYGRGQEELYEQASKNKVVFLRFEADESPEVNRSDGFQTTFPCGSG